MPDYKKIKLILSRGVLIKLAGVFFLCLTVAYGLVWLINTFDNTGLYLIFVLALGCACAYFVATRNNPSRFAILSGLILMPVWAFPVPPGRFGWTIFDCVLLAVFLWLFFSKIFHSNGFDKKFYISSCFSWALILSVPLVLFSWFPLFSAWIFIENLLIYIFFVFVLREIEREGEVVVLCFAIGIGLLGIGVVFEKYTGVNLSLKGANINLLDYSGGFLIYRAGGFFQDAQKAAQVLGAGGVFLFSLAVGRPFESKLTRRVVIFGALLAMLGLFLTASRSALISTFFVAILILVFGVGRRAARVATVMFGVAVFITYFVSPEGVLSLLPLEISTRLDGVDSDYMSRVEIWFDTWDMFDGQPITGIGLGSFQSYLMEKASAMTSYMGMGEDGEIYVPDQPESGYFKILYEGGILGCFAVLLLVISTLRAAWSVLCIPNGNEVSKSEVKSALAALMVFGISFVTLFTPSDERCAAMFAIPLAFIWAHALALESRKQGVRDAG